VGRQTRAFVGALALHVLAAALLSMVRVPPTVIAPPSPILELEWAAPPPRAATAKPVAVLATATPRPPVRRPAAVAAAPPSRAVAPPEPPAPPAPATAAAPPASAKGSAGPPQLFPRGLLQELADKNAGPPPWVKAPSPAKERDRETPGGWLEDAAAEARTRSGQVDHVWRQIERELVLSFKPSIDVVHEVPTRKIDRFGDRLRSFVQQAARVVARGEDGLRHPPEPGARDFAFGANGSIDPSNQGFPGVSEGLNLRSMPLTQQQAVVAATQDPASWLEVEIEITVDEAGKVTRSRVAFPSGRRVFDRYALHLIEELVAKATPPSSVSRWVCKAGYAVSRPDAISLDVLKLFSRTTIRDSLLYPLKDRVEASVSLKWVKEQK
jgi:TonB family protein